MKLWLFVIAAFAALLFSLTGNAQLGLPASAPLIKASAAPPVSVPCDLVTCSAAWGMRLLKSTATHCMDLKDNAANTTTINFSGKYCDTGTATTFCATHPPCVITKIYDQVGSQDCTPPGGQEPTYDSTTTINSIPSIKFAQGNSQYCAATLSSGITTGTVVATSAPNSASNSTLWAYSAGVYAGARENSTTTFAVFSYNNSSNFLDNTVTIVAAAFMVGLESFDSSASTGLHIEINGTANPDVGSQTLSSGTAFDLGRDPNAGGNYFDGHLADLILIAESNTNGRTIACSEKTAWGISVSGC